MAEELFFGRQNEVSKIIQQLNTPGQHSILFGDRGVGKSSLANITSTLLKTMAGGKLIKKRCDSNDIFTSIVSDLLSEVGIDIHQTSSQHQRTEGGSAGLNIPLAKASIDTKKTETSNCAGYESRANSPSWVAQQIKDIEGLFLLDEIDTIKNEEKLKIAELIKQLSDENSKLKFLVVGIAETAQQLTNGHPSVQRCLKETHLRKMYDQELEKIVTSGEEKLQIKFSTEAIKEIVKVSSGYPHFTHLLALKAAENAIGQGRTNISKPDILNATANAADDAEGTLRTKYNSATRSASTEEFKKILIASAMFKSDEFRS